MIKNLKLPIAACLASLRHLHDNAHVLDMHGSLFDKADSFVKMLASLRRQLPDVTMPDLVGFCLTTRKLLKREETPVFLRSKEDDELFDEIRDKFRESEKKVEGMGIAELTAANLLEKCLKHRLLLLCQKNIAVFAETLSCGDKIDLLNKITKEINDEGFELTRAHVEMFVTTVGRVLDGMRLPSFARNDADKYGILIALCNARRKAGMLPDTKADIVTPKKRRGKKRKLPEDDEATILENDSVPGDATIPGDAVDPEAEKTMENVLAKEQVSPPVVKKNPLSDDQKISTLKVLKSFPQLLLTRSCGWTGKVWMAFLPELRKVDDTIPEKNLRVYVQHLRARNIRSGLIPKLPREGINVFLELLGEVSKNGGKSHTLIARYILKKLRGVPKLLEIDLGEGEKDVSLIAFAQDVSQYAGKEMTVAEIHSMVQEWRRDFEENGVYPSFFTNAKVHLKRFIKLFVRGDLSPEAVAEIHKTVAAIKREVIEENIAPEESKAQAALELLLNKCSQQDEEVVQDEGEFELPFSVKREAVSPVREVQSPVRLVQSPIRDVQSPVRQVQSPRSVLSDPNDIFEDVGSGGEMDLEKLGEDELISEGSGSSVSSHYDWNINSDGDGYTSATDDEPFNPFKTIAADKSPIREPEPQNTSSDKSWRFEEL